MGRIYSSGTRVRRRAQAAPSQLDKEALLGLFQQYDLKQFDAYGRAGMIVGIAAGLRGMGAPCVPQKV